MKLIEDQLFIWKIDGAPDVGTLGRYAKIWEHAQYGGDIVLSDTVMTWDDDDAITYDVRCQRMGADEDDLIRYEFSVTGFSGCVTIAVDGRA